MLRAVFDANVLISALLRPEGPPGELLRLAMVGNRLQIVLSPEIHDELRRVVEYPRIRRRIQASPGEMADWLNGLVRSAVWVQPDALMVEALVDPDDSVYLGAALAADADLVVSGDRHLLALREFRGIPLVTPRELVRLLEGGFVAERQPPEWGRRLGGPG